MMALKSELIKWVLGITTFLMLGLGIADFTLLVLVFTSPLFYETSLFSFLGEQSQLAMNMTAASAEICTRLLQSFDATSAEALIPLGQVVLHGLEQFVCSTSSCSDQRAVCYLSSEHAYFSTASEFANDMQDFVAYSQGMLTNETWQAPAACGNFNAITLDFSQFNNELDNVFAARFTIFYKAIKHSVIAHALLVFVVIASMFVNFFFVIRPVARTLSSFTAPFNPKTISSSHNDQQQILLLESQHSTTAPTREAQPHDIDIIGDSSSQELSVTQKQISVPSLSSLRVLVVEDNVMSQKIILKFLKSLQLPSVDLAVNGSEAVQFVNKGTYDMIFMDVHMPKMNGLEATQSIRSKQITQPLIVGLTSDPDRAQCFAAGMDDYLPKPITMTLLQQTLNKWVVLKQAEPI